MTLYSVFQHGNNKSTKTSIEDNIRSKMSRASSLPSTNKNHQQSTSSLSCHRSNAPTQAEVVKNRILKTETENQMMHELLRNNGGGSRNHVKIEHVDVNPESPFVDVEALSDGDEKVECEQGKQFILKTKKSFTFFTITFFIFMSIYYFSMEITDNLHL